MPKSEPAVLQRVSLKEGTQVAIVTMEGGVDHTLLRVVSCSNAEKNYDLPEGVAVPDWIDVTRLGEDSIKR